jgi:hypothetical protein
MLHGELIFFNTKKIIKMLESKKLDAYWSKHF